MADGASSSGADGKSAVIDHGRRRTSCGYCRSGTYSSISHGLWANTLTADDYQELLDRGWRRSGCFLYKPELESTCCPSYTIRLKASDFIPSKEQARVLKKMQRYLDGVTDVKNGMLVEKISSLKPQGCGSSSAKVSTTSVDEPPSGNSQNLSKDDEFICCLSNKIDGVVSACFGGSEFPSGIILPKTVVKKVNPHMKRKLADMAEDLLYTCSIAFQIAAAIRNSARSEKNVANLGSSGIVNESGESLDISPNTIAEKLAKSMQLHGEIACLVTKSNNGHLNFYSATKQTPSDLSTKAPEEDSKGDGGSSKQIQAIHSSRCCPYKRRKLEIRMIRSNFDPEEFALYRKYQMRVHNDEIVAESSYKRFLVDTPIMFVPPRDGDSTIPPCGFGSFHQQYRINGKLVAVGVVDILPRCLSSKYLFWDPDLAFLSLGKYSALKEINWVKETQVRCPRLQYYYLGYYIHSCSKMRYKAAYRPSELLCPVRYEWVRYDVAKPLLDKSQYCVLSDSAKFHGQAPLSQAAGTSDDCSRCLSSDESSSDEDEENDFEYEDQDAEPYEEPGSEATGEMIIDNSKNADISNIVIDFNGSLVRFKDIQRVFGATSKRHMAELERQLQRYARVLGKELCDRMVYVLG